MDFVRTIDETHRARACSDVTETEIVRHAGSAVRLNGPVDDDSSALRARRP